MIDSQTATATDPDTGHDASAADIVDGGAGERAVPDLDAGDDGDTDAGEDGETAHDGEAGVEMGEDAGASCPTTACQRDASCTASAGGPICQCPLGWTSDNCEIEVVTCTANHLCTSPDYVCVETASSGYVCEGQFADWPMPDAMPGAKFAPSYDRGDVDVVVDLVTGLVWQRSIEATLRTWRDAKEYCQSLDTGGRTDWRLPSKIELESIVDETRHNPSIDPAAFPSTPNGYFWSSSPDPEVPPSLGYVWAVHFGEGYQGDGLRSDRYAVRCVSGPATTRGAGTPASRYGVDLGSDTVLDRRTELVWQGAISADSFEWEAANSFCAGLGAGFRLPALKELLTLIDPTTASPNSGFPDTPATFFWSSSIRTGVPDQAWSVLFPGGTSTYADTSLPRRVRCVR